MVDGESHWVQVEFEKNAWSAAVCLEGAGVMGDAVLMGAEPVGPGCDVGCRDDMQEILVCNIR